MKRASSPFQRGGNLRDSLGTTLNGLLQQVSPEDLAQLKRAVREEGITRGIVYEDDQGHPRPTPILLRPRILGGNQRTYLHRITRVLENAWMRLLSMWREDAEVRALLPLSEPEQRWIRELWNERQAEVCFGRFDATCDAGSADWVKSTQFYEFNPVGAGGTFLAAAIDDIILRNVVPVLRRHAPTLLLEPNDDPRRVLLEVLADHARSLKLRRFNVALCQFKDLQGGMTEFPQNAEFLRTLGVNAWHADPRELRLKDGEIYFNDLPIDIVYRDHEIPELAAFEAEGADLSALKHAIATNRCVSSLAGEIDHKSAFHVLTDPRFAQRFSALERRVFQRHVPWTRIVAEGRTSGPAGEAIELVPWLRREREATVLKPNRAYGGAGILIGRELSERAYDLALERALAHPGEWVVQSYYPVAEKDFPVVDEDGNLGLAEYHTVLGLFASEQRLGILGRASRKRVVNVAQRGGVVAVLRLL